MAQSHPPFSGPAYGWPQGQPSRQEVSLIFPPSPQKPSAVPSGSITEVGNGEGNREDEYDGGVRPKRKRKSRDNFPSGGVGSQSPPSKRTRKDGPGPIYACPYFKNNPLKYQDCAEWWNRETHRVKEHCKRSHLKPLLCYNCGSYRTGDQGQLRIHSEKCKIRASKITPVPREDVIKATSLETRGLNWKQMYQILFLGEKIPTPFWEEGIIPETSPEPQVHPSFAHDSSLADYTSYLQSQLSIVPGVMENLRREYLSMLSLQPYGQPPPPRATSAEDDGFDIRYGYNDTHPPIHHPVAQSSDTPGTYSYITDPQNLPSELCDDSSSSQYLYQGTIYTNTDETLPALSERHQFEQAGRRGPSYNYRE